MKTAMKWLGRILLTAVLAAVVVGIWKREEISRLLTVNSLFDADNIVGNFSNMDAAFLHTPVSRGDGPVSELPVGDTITLPDAAAAWLVDRNVTSLLVLKDGEIVFEDYYLGTQPDDKRISWSIAKSYLSVLAGIVFSEGHIASLDDPVVEYAPELVGGAYEDVTVRHVLNMSTGVTFDEDYLDPRSDINRMGRVLALGQKMDAFAGALTERYAAPGEKWQYTSIDTHVLGMVIRGATGRPIGELLSEKVIAPLGLEAEPYYVTDGVGTAFVLGGLNMTTRDYARFGQMVLEGGTWQGQRIVDADWLVASTSPQAPEPANPPSSYLYGYQWWIPVEARPREYIGRGIYGQYLYVNEPAGVVIVTTAADRKFRESDVQTSNLEMFRMIVDGK